MLILELLNRQRYLKEELVALEITPLANEIETTDGIRQLFNVLHGTLKRRFLGRPRFSLEIHSTKTGGIRFIIISQSKYIHLLMRHVASYAPTAKLKIIPLPKLDFDLSQSFKTKASFMLPISLRLSNLDRDKLNHVIGAMSNPADNELLGLQLIIKPINLSKTRSLERKILNNENIFTRSTSHQVSLLNIVNNILYHTTNLLSEACQGVFMGNYHTKPDNSKTQAYQHQKPSRSLSSFEIELINTVHHKITQPLFKVNLRVFVRSKQANRYLDTIRSALSSYNRPSYQKLVAMRPKKSHYYKYLIERRLPTLDKDTMILSSEELSELYHLPETKGRQPDGLEVALSHSLPAPSSLRRRQNLGLVIGRNQHHGLNTPISLTNAERERHLYIVGGTGNGKTTMLLYSIMQDIKAGHGLAIVDPHGDLSADILSHLPKERLKDIVYFNPDDLAYPVGLNLLELSKGLTGDDLAREKDLITESVISVMRKVFSTDDSGGHRVEYVLRNAIQTALTLENPTIFTIFKLLNDARYRRDVVKSVKDENLKSFWQNEIGQAGNFQRVKMSAGITSKIGRFLFSASARRTLGQAKSSIDFDDILNSGKILICNLSKGLLGEDTSALFGTTILAKLQLAALKRARLPLSKREDFYLYVDEFQNFATMSFIEMLSEARKYRLFLTMAEQSTAQQEQSRLTDVILANVGTVVCFRSGSPADEARLLPLFTPYLKAGEISHLPAYSFYVRISAVDSQAPLSGTTLLLQDKEDPNVAEQAIKASRLKYGKKFTKPGCGA